MKFTRIKRLVSFGNHENIELEAEIEEGESVEDAHKALSSEILKQIGRLRDMDYVTRDLSELKSLVQSRLNQKEKLDIKIKELEIKKNDIQAWLTKFSIPSDAFNEDEIPF